MRRNEQLSMPWHGPTEPGDVSALYDDHDAVMLAAEPFDDPAAPWRVVVTWEHREAAWRPVEVSVQSTTAAPVTASLWRSVPVTRAIRWSSAALRERGALAAGSARSEVAEDLASRVYDSEASRDGRVEYGADHWGRVVEAWENVGPVHDRRRAVARYLRDRWPDDQRYRTITGPSDTRVKGWLDRMAKDGRITRSADTTKGGER